MTFFASNQSNGHVILFSAGVSSDPNVEDCSKVPKTKMPWCRCGGRKNCSFLKTDGHVNDPHTNLFWWKMRNVRTIYVAICTGTYIYILYTNLKEVPDCPVPCYHFRVSVAHVENISLLENSGCLLSDSLSKFSDLSPSRVNLLLFGIEKKSRPFLMPSSRGTVTCQKSEATRILVGFVRATPERWVYRFFWWSECGRAGTGAGKKTWRNIHWSTGVVLDHVIFKSRGLLLHQNYTVWVGRLTCGAEVFGAKIVDIRNHPTTEW